MLASDFLVSAVIFLAGQSQCAPILGLDDGSLDNNDKLLGGLTHTVNALPITGKLTNGLLGVSQDGTAPGLSTVGLLGEPKVADVLGSSSNGLLEGSKSRGLTLSGYTGQDPLLNIHSLLGESSLHKRFSFPLMGGLEGFDGFTAKAKSKASNLGSKFAGLLHKRDYSTPFSVPALTSALNRVPFVGFIPGVPNIPALSTLPGISDIPGLSLVPGLGSTTAASGLGATVTSLARTHEQVTMATLTDGPAQGINTAFTGLLGGLSNAPLALDNFF